MTNKILASSLVILAALGLAGCTNSATAPTKTSTSATKVSQQPTKQAASSASSKKAKEQTLPSASDQATSANRTSSKISVVKSSSNSTNQATKTSSSSVMSSQASANSQPVATNSNFSSQSDQQVLTSFAQKSDIHQDGNHYYMTKDNQNNNYQIEVRNNQGGDPNVAHLTGTYQYDPATNQIHKMNPVTGNYDN